MRQYLTRMQQLDPQVGWSMAERLASDLAERTGAPVPQGVPPAAYLAAVVQERQAREARRAFGSGSSSSAGPVAGADAASAAETASAAGAAPDAYGQPPFVPPGAPSQPSGAAAESSGGARPAAPHEVPAGERPGTGFVPPA
ncbi:hypothetical protein STAFG_7191 [Streptomyces afghaniensis 772]|uniref:Uncharacterized protein n=1 Tax=Streptomyces afghaniensis 772 TaxID=1283301 RepID=S4MGX1_9ACTN|nr:hypothetical protein STAFG_7191 [Streptomyces afghaniensis 772]